MGGRMPGAGPAALLVCLAACGRIGFDPGGSDGSAGSGSNNVVADFSGVVPYDPNDFIDNGVPSNNGPHAVTWLAAPFAEGFAVAAGRSIIEIRLDGTTVVHDYRPAMYDTTGPDEITRLTMADVLGLGPRLWLVSNSTMAGDGLYNIDPSWQITRVNMTNNSSGVALDPAGTFDSLGTPTLYVGIGTIGVVRQDTLASTTVVSASPPTASDVSVMTAGPLLYAADVDNTDTWSLSRTDSVSHQRTAVDTASQILLADGELPDATIGVAVRTTTDVIEYHPDGTSDVIATVPDAQTVWGGMTIPRAPHPLAGKMIVIEENTTLSVERLVMVP